LATAGRATNTDGWEWPSDDRRGSQRRDVTPQEVGERAAQGKPGAGAPAGATGASSATDARAAPRRIGPEPGKVGFAILDFDPGKR
jgi:hypothetical protein